MFLFLLPWWCDHLGAMCFASGTNINNTTEFMSSKLVALSVVENLKQ